MTALEQRIASARGELEALCAALVAIPSENPPGDTTALAASVERYLSQIPGMQVRRVVAREPMINLIARLPGGRPGRRLLMNGHLDTFPAGDANAWKSGPFSGAREDGRLYGRGSCDMKAGLAAALMAARLLAEVRESLAGELVLAFVSDEETGGKWGTQYILANVPEARGDAMLSADAGSPRVVRFGEKGQLWIELVAQGRSNHGAHVHLGDNAIERLMQGLAALKTIESIPCPVPADVLRAMQDARPVSEPISGAGEFDTLSRITVNIGVIEGGVSVNVIPGRATARCDVRFPPGLALKDVLGAIGGRLAAHPALSWSVLSSHEPNVTPPGSEIVQTVLRHAAATVDGPVVANMRPGFSDSRFYRALGIPSVVYGPAPNNMGGADEYVLLEDLYAVFRVHTLAAADYLGQRPA